MSTPTDNRFALDAAAVVQQLSRDIALDTAQLQVQAIVMRLGADKGLVSLKRAKA